MRLFVAIDIPDEIRHKLARFVEGVRGLAPEVRFVKPETFHVTLKFIGEQPAAQLAEINRLLTSAKAPEASIHFHGTGFFPTPRSARVFWVGMESSESLPQLAASIDAALSQLGIEREQRPFSPHLTLGRTGSGVPRRRPGDQPNAFFSKLQERLAAMPPPDFGRMTAQDFFLYESKLSSAGAKYSKLEKFEFA